MEHATRVDRRLSSPLPAPGCSFNLFQNFSDVTDGGRPALLASSATAFLRDPQLRLGSLSAITVSLGD